MSTPHGDACHAGVEEAEVDPLLPRTSDGIPARRPAGVFKRDVFGERMEPLTFVYRGIEDDRHVWVAVFTEWRTGDRLFITEFPPQSAILVADNREHRDPD